MKPEIRVNRKFLVVFITFQILLVGLILFAVLSPKEVTVHVEKLERAFETIQPVTITPPNISETTE